MAFRLIDRSKWKREEYFQHYFSEVPCTYSITAKLDITRLKTANVKLYPAMLYLLSRMVNRHEEFRVALNADGQLGVFDWMIPCYTVFHNECETFSNIWTEYSEDYADFLSGYERDMAIYGAVQRMEAKPDTPENTFPVSMIPWTAFSGFNLNLPKGNDYLTPIFTMGKYEDVNGKRMLPLAVQAHHGVCDGFHVSRLINEVQEAIDAWE